MCYLTITLKKEGGMMIERDKKGFDGREGKI